jgi:hypothetical protein
MRFVFVLLLVGAFQPSSARDRRFARPALGISPNGRVLPNSLSIASGASFCSKSAPNFKCRA